MKSSPVSCGRKLRPSGRNTVIPLPCPGLVELVEENYYRFNLVQHKAAFFALHQDVGPYDLAAASAEEQQTLKASGKLLAEGSLSELKALIRQAELMERLRETQSQLRRLEFDLQAAAEEIRQTRADLVNQRSASAILAAKLRRGWHYLRDSIAGREVVGPVTTRRAA
jgi:hypothetical protein